MFARAGLRTLRTLPPASVARASSAIAQRRALTDQARKLIDHAVQENPLVVFMKGTPDAPQCGFSRAVVQILDVQGVPREKVLAFNCLEDPELREGIKEYSDWPTIPQVYVKGEFVGGCDIMISSMSPLLSELTIVHQSGELEDLLVKEGLAPPIEEEVKEEK